MLATVGPPSSPASQRNLRKRQLSDTKQRLVVLLQNLCFGTVHDLRIRDGEPAFTPPPKVIRRVKVGGQNTARPQAAAADFTLKQEWVDFFNHIEELRDGTILEIEVAHGLPLFFEVEQSISA